MAGYSQTPLVKKLGLKPGISLALVNYDPAEYLRLLQEPPAGLHFTQLAPASLDFIHAFCTHQAELQGGLPFWKAALRPAGTLWISWPKGSSRLSSELNENIIREAGLAIGLVDVKICAVDSTWSGLKFVYRLKDRSPATSP